MKIRGFPRLLIAILTIAPYGAWAQEPRTTTLTGEIKTDQTFLNLCIELDDVQTHQRLALEDIGTDGSFRLMDVQTGDYEIKITDRFGEVYYDHLARVTLYNAPVTITLTHRGTPTSPAGTTVSAAELLHPLSKRAMQSMEAASRFSAAGDHGAAAAELEKAARDAPENPTVLVNLAAEHIKTGRYRDALDELARATQMTRPTALILSNEAFAQAALGQRADALESARNALTLDGAYAPAHYILGAMLANDPAKRPEAIEHLAYAARTIGSARAMLEKVRRDTLQ